MICRAVAIVIPARNEAATIAACLDSVVAATQALASVPSVVVVVDDGSSDRTSAIARARLCGQAHLLVHRNESNVGRARAAGVARALRALHPVPTEAIWLAFTDADTTVATDWLRRQVTWAADGAAAVAGIVQLPPPERGANATYEAIYAEGVWQHGHRQVHGANMGVSATSYLAVGGFSDLCVGEDHDLWQRLQDAGLRVVADPQLAVQTSARRTGRAVGGLATFLMELETKAIDRGTR